MSVYISPTPYIRPTPTPSPTPYISPTPNARGIILNGNTQETIFLASLDFRRTDDHGGTYSYAQWTTDEYGRFRGTIVGYGWFDFLVISAPGCETRTLTELEFYAQPVPWRIKLSCPDRP
jgi:hypothetical protein